MIPILYSANETEFRTNGMGRLSDCISCTVTEQRNGVFECEFEYPITGIHYSDISEGKIISVTHDEHGDRQPLVIYRRSAAINGVVRFFAHHISYELAGVIVSPFTANSITQAFSGFGTHLLTSNRFTFWTDKTSAGSFEVKVPTSIRALLGGTDGSILDVFGGGEYKWDKFNVMLYAQRGRNTGVTIRYGKNLTDIVNEVDALDLYSGVIPYWKDNEGNVVYGGVVSAGGVIQLEHWQDENGTFITDENGESLEFAYRVGKTVPMDLSSYFEEQPTAAQLEARAATVLNANKPWIPKNNITVDFVALWQTEEYKNIAPLERVRLCDTVNVRYPELGVDVTAKVVSVVWDALLDRYQKIELGQAKTSFAEVLTAETDAKLADVPNNSMMQAAIDHATEQITGTNGGNIRFSLNANGQPYEQLIMDTADVTTAVNVWRWNLGGLGHSHSGYNGPFDDVAITQDGKINASMITVGLMSFNRLQGGTITLGGSGTGNGTLELYDSNDGLIGTFDSGGVNITQGSFTTSSGVYKSSISGGRTSYYNDDDFLGYIGTHDWTNHPEYKGLLFELETDGSYMGFFARSSSASQTYDAKLWYAKNAIDDVVADTMNLGCAFDCNNYEIMNPTWDVNGTRTWGITNKANFVAINQMSSDGKAARWTNGCSLTFSNGILIAGVMPWES